MRQFFLGILLPFILTSLPSNLLAKEIPIGDLHQNTTSTPDTDKFYTKSAYFVQQQLYLVNRLQDAFSSPDANKMRSVRGQLISQTINIDNFLKQQYPNPQSFCSQDNFTDQSNLSSLPVQFDESTAKIYCGLYSSTQELFKLRPLLDQLLSRRGEIGLVRELPLVSGEKKSDPILPIATIQRPDLNKPAKPFANREPEKLISPPLPIIGKNQKQAIVNYVPPIQPAIVAPGSAMKNLENASQFLQTAELAFPGNMKFIHPQETQIALRRLAYNVDSQDIKKYNKFLELPNTGIARILTDLVYRRRLNFVENRLENPVNNYPVNLQFTTEESFNPSVALQLVKDKFQLVPESINYGFMVDVGDISLSQLDSNLKPVDESIKNFFLSYKPPTKLESLQVDRRRFLTGKDQVWNLPEVILADAQVGLNKTYLLRSLQFKLPEIILKNQTISRRNSRLKQELGKVPSSDTIIAFRTIRDHSDGSYTILWRIIQHLPAPQIEDLENYVQY